MPSTNGSISKKDLVIFYVIDVSGSMDGEKITAVNSSMEDNVRMLRSISEEYAEISVKLAVLTFANKARWLTPGGPESIKDFHWKRIEKTGGGTVFGNFIEELESKLHSSEFLKSGLGLYMPVIIFISDGGPTDEGWREILADKLQANPWLRDARKIAIALDDGDSGSDAKEMRAALTELVGSSSAVIDLKNLEKLKEQVTSVSCASLSITVQSRLLRDSYSAADIIRNAGNTPQEIFADSLDRIGNNKNTFARNRNEPEPGDWNDEDWTDDQSIPQS